MENALKKCIKKNATLIFLHLFPKMYHEPSI